MKNGFVLITCLAVVIVVAIGAAAVLQALGSNANIKANNLQELQATYLAEAGMEYALWKCRAVNGGCVDNAAYAIAGETQPVAIDVTILAGGSYTIQTTVDFANI